MPAEPLLTRWRVSIGQATSPAHMGGVHCDLEGRANLDRDRSEAGYEAIAGLIDPQPIDHLSALALAGAVGFAGN